MNKTLKQDPEQFRTGKVTAAPAPKLEVVSFEDELRKAMKARVGKAPSLGKEDAMVFIELCSELRSLPGDSAKATNILDRIHKEALFLQCDRNWQEFQQRIYPLAAGGAEGVADKQGHPERQPSTVAPQAQVPPVKPAAPVPKAAAQPVETHETLSSGQR